MPSVTYLRIRRSRPGFCSLFLEEFLRTGRCERLKGNPMRRTAVLDRVSVHDFPVLGETGSYCAPSASSNLRFRSTGLSSLRRLTSAILRGLPTVAGELPSST